MSSGFLCRWNRFIADESTLLSFQSADRLFCLKLDKPETLSKYLEQNIL